MPANSGRCPRTNTTVEGAFSIFSGRQRTAITTRDPDLKTVIGASLSRVQIPAPPPCPVSGHRGHLLQDIVHRPAASETVVVSIWLESQSSEELTVLGDDADVGVGDEKVGLPVLGGGTDGDVAE